MRLLLSVNLRRRPWIYATTRINRAMCFSTRNTVLYCLGFLAQRSHISKRNIPFRPTCYISNASRNGSDATYNYICHQCLIISCALLKLCVSFCESFSLAHTHTHRNEAPYIIRGAHSDLTFIYTFIHVGARMDVMCLYSV